MPERELSVARAGLPERARVQWRATVDEAALRRRAHWWTMTTILHSVPFVLGACAVVTFRLVLLPVSIVLLIHAWAIPELYAARGAGVLRRRPSPRAGAGPRARAGAGPRARAGAGPRARAGAASPDADAAALLLLGDLLDDANRRLHADTGLVPHPGRLGVWVLGESGAVLVAPGGRRVFCYCVRVPDRNLPHGDRIAHLLLALRCDERDFATIANLAFSGAVWRVRRRVAPVQRPALRAAVDAARRMR